MSQAEERSKILLVEDEALVRMSSADLLEYAGYRVVEAEDAAEAVKALRENPDIRVLFTDVRMPGEMDGLELARLVHEKWPAIKLLVASGHHQLEDDDIPDDGRFLQKPYRLNAVLRDIGEMLAGKPSDEKREDRSW
jgi:CheY-like chemotaxis protein